MPLGEELKVHGKDEAHPSIQIKVQIPGAISSEIFSQIFCEIFCEICVEIPAQKGAHMIGAEVMELIQGFAIARQYESTEAELMGTVCPHPTLSEMMHESVLDAFGQVIHF